MRGVEAGRPMLPAPEARSESARSVLGGMSRWSGRRGADAGER